MIFIQWIQPLECPLLRIVVLSQIEILLSLIYCFFLMKPLKFQKMSDWNELSNIAGKWKFCRIYWYWILIEQTSLYAMVYRIFLYNPTNLKVPKKHRVRMVGANLKWNSVRDLGHANNANAGCFTSRYAHPKVNSLSKFLQ